MRAGRLRDTLLLQERTVTENPEGNFDITWTKRPLRIYGEPDRSSELSCRFLIRYRKEVTPASHRIIWDDAVWTIVTAVHDLKRRSLTIDCDFSNLIDATSLLSTETEYLDAVPVLRPRE